MSARFTSNGVAIAYETAGAGRPVVLVHGFASSRATNWRDTGWIRLLADQGYFVVAPDCRGHGDSEKLYDQAAYRLSLLALDIVNLLAHLGLPHVALIGYSMGARIALRVAMEHAPRVTGAVLGGLGLNHHVPDFVARVKAAMQAPEAASVTDPVGQRFRQFADRQKADRAALAACIEGTDEALDGAALAKIRLPVLIVTGTRDDIAAPPEPLAAAIPDARVVHLPDKDHMSAVGDTRHKQAALAFLRSLAW